MTNQSTKPGFAQRSPEESLALYAKGPDELEVTLFRVIHRHILELAQHVPDAWEHYIQYPDGPKRSFGFYIQLVTSHALEHIDEILEIRRIHDV